MIDMIQSIHDGKVGTLKEQELIRNYLMFDGMSEDIGNYCYCFSFNHLMDMYKGKARNKYLWITYNNEIVYVKGA